MKQTFEISWSGGTITTDLLYSMFGSYFLGNVEIKEITSKLNTQGGELKRKPWIGVDLDGTLAHHETHEDIESVGEPILVMMERVRNWLKEGITVKIVTARTTIPGQELLIHTWLEKHGLPKLVVTNAKDLNMIELWDNRCISVETNTGRILKK